MGIEKSNRQILHKKLSKPVLEISDFSSLQFYFFVG